jgi:Kef-type K+ transport system membrane component KefB/mannitol/fructose-specific phosphotransferase system IIA component
VESTEPVTLNDPSPLLILAVVVVAGVISGNLARMIRLPSVTGQILIGIVLGPSLLNLFEKHAVHGLAPVTHFALAIIAVAVGSHLHLPRLKNARRRLLALFGAEITITPAIVFLGVIFLPGVDWTLALLLAALAISTAPATVLALVKEERAEGVFVKTLIAAVALNNLACISAFEVAHLTARAWLDTDDDSLLLILLSPARQILLASLLGGGIAMLLTLLSRNISNVKSLATVSVAAILLTAGLADAFGISALLSCLLFGFVLANMAPENEDIGHTVFDNFEGVIYAAFFTLAGMELDLKAAVAGGLVAGVVVVTRILGKVTAARVAMKFADAPESVQRYLGVALVPQAGVAVGLVLVAQEDPTLGDMRQMLLAIGLTVVTVAEIVGPMSTRWALHRSGDAGRDRERLIDFVHEQNITTRLSGPDKETAIRQLVNLMVQSHGLNVNRDELYDQVMKREQEFSTCIGGGLAIPHAILPDGSEITGVIGINREGLDFDTPDHIPVHCMVLLATPQNMRDRHLEVVGALARTIGHDPNLQHMLFGARSPAHVCEILRHEAFEEINIHIDQV